MACTSCGKKKQKTKSAVYSGISFATKQGYIEGQDGYTEVVYTGQSILKVRGKFTDNHYLFGGNAVRRIDSNDAQYFMSTRTDFEYAESSISETLTNTESSKTEDFRRNEQISSLDD